jgi:hypothetical protein
MAHRHRLSRTLIEHDKERVVRGLFPDLIEVRDDLKFAGD